MQPIQSKQKYSGVELHAFTKYHTSKIATMWYQLTVFSKLLKLKWDSILQPGFLLSKDLFLFN